MDINNVWLTLAILRSIKVPRKISSVMEADSKMNFLKQLGNRCFGYTFGSQERTTYILAKW